MREKRVELQNEIIKKFNLPILVLRANYPGENKNNFVPKHILEFLKDEITELYNSDIIFSKKLDSIEGPSYIYVINDSGEKIKKTAMIIEEKHFLGRFVDIDVFDSNGYAFSRKDFHAEKRKCILCEEMAFVCARKYTHTQKEVQNAIQNRLEEYIEKQKLKINIIDTFSNLALKSVILEVSTFPSFGLVSPQSNGSHDDMDFFTFIHSGFSLSNYFKQIVKAGYSELPIHLIFKKIRYMGKNAEKEMFTATNNVNTHKGLIFLMGITAACAAKAKHEKLSFENISFFIKEMCKDILKDFDNIHLKKTLTHGEKLFITHGVIGVRGVVKNGLDMVFNGAIESFKNALANNEHINHAMIKTLIYLMSILEDTTILHRHDINVLNEVKTIATNLHQKFYIDVLDIPLLVQIEKDFINKKISPGGAADLLAITMFLAFISDDF